MDKNPNIVFVSNDYKTILQAKIAIKLITLGYNVMFITFNTYFDDYVKNLGIKTLRIKFREIALVSDDVKACNFSMIDLVSQDPALKQNVSMGLSYLRQLRQMILTEFNNDRCTIFFGENSRGHETLLARMCCNREILGRYVTPCTARYPAHKFFAFDDQYQQTWITPSTEYVTSQIHSAVESSTELPYYEHTLNYLENKGKIFNLLKKFFNLYVNPIYDVDDVHFSNGLFKFAVSRLKHKIRRIVYLNFVHRSNLVPNNNFVLIPLQRDPESTVDVLGRYSENQLQLINDVSRWVPDDVTVVVKEHRTAIGDRDYSFYRSIANMSDVVLLNEKVPAKELLESALCVVSISGTASLEAVFKGTPAFIRSDCYMNYLSGIHTLSEPDLRSDFKDLLSSMQDELNSPIDYQRFIDENTYCGFIGDHLTEPYVLEPKNIDNITRSFEDIISKCAKN